jgi:Uma2 family endonuclease
LPNVSREEYFTASDLNGYYDVAHPLWHKRPDWFLAVDVPALYEGRDLRLSYVVWQEGQSPHVVVEFLSPSTEREDLGRFYTPADQAPGEPSPFGADRSTPRKLAVYEDYLRVPHYLVYSRYTQKLRYFQWLNGEYVEQTVAETNPMIWFPDLQVGLGVWAGNFEGVPAHWLRWCDESGHWFLTDTEQARLAEERERRAKEQAQLAEERERWAKEQAQLAEEQERRAKEQAQQRADKLAAKLRELGIAPDDL